MLYKVDLHTHSIISHDGGIRAEQYAALLQKGILDCVAITDHNETRFARVMHDKLGEKIIVGEEIMTKDGEMIGLFLQNTIQPGMSAKATAAAIRTQGGLVYIPHPFETLRKGIQRRILEQIKASIDIIEVFNARGRGRGKAEGAESFAKWFHLAEAASSDAHCRSGVGTAYTVIDKFPKRETLKNMLKRGSLNKKYAPLWTYLCPAVNRVKNKIVLEKG